MPGSADTLREYWSGHGHAGPSHGVPRDEIAWGTPGDFDRCVAQVTAHGRMSEEQAKGYCNLRHHDATGEWPAQHAHGKQQRVAAGDTRGGEFGSTGGGAAAQAAMYNAVNQAGMAQAAHGRPQAHPAHQGQPASGRAAHRAHLQHEIHQLKQELAGLEQQKRALSATGVRSFGTKPTVHGSRGAGKPSKKPSSASGGKKPGSGSKKPSRASSALASINSRIASVQAQIHSLEQQLTATKAKKKKPTEIVVLGDGDKDGDGDGLFDADGDGDGAVAVRADKSVRNPRDVGSGRFRTFEGELHEAKQALAEGRMNDVTELLGSARALAKDDRQRLILGELQGAIGRVQHIQPELTKRQARRFDSRMAQAGAGKVGPHGYSHGWIKAGDVSGPTGLNIRNGDRVKGSHPEHGSFDGIVVGSVSGPSRTDGPVTSTTTSGHYVAPLGTDTRNTKPIKVDNGHITHVMHAPAGGFPNP